MTYRVELTARAEADLDRIYERLSRGSAKGAARWYESFWNAVERFKTHPLSCVLAFEHDQFREELRHFLFGTRQGRTYRALFVVRGDVVKTVAVRWPGERPMKPRDVDI
jgi:plasmid stabilization system protein ParE